MTDPTQIHAPAPAETEPRPHYTSREKAKGWMQLVRLPMLLTAPGDSMGGALFMCLMWKINSSRGCYSSDISPVLKNSTRHDLW